MYHYEVIEIPLYAYDHQYNKLAPKDFNNNIFSCKNVMYQWIFGSMWIIVTNILLSQSIYAKCQKKTVDKQIFIKITKIKITLPTITTPNSYIGGLRVQ